VQRACCCAGGSRRTVRAANRGVDSRKTCMSKHSYCSLVDIGTVFR